jgi:hypothetical protein
MQSPSKFQWHSFRGRKINLKVHIKAQKTMNSQGNTEQKEQHRRYHNTCLQTILQSHSNKNSMVLIQKQIWRPMEQNRRHRLNTQSYSHLIFEKGTQNICWRKDSLFNKWCWKNWIPTSRRMKLNSTVFHCVLISIQSGSQILV